MLLHHASPCSPRLLALAIAGLLGLAGTPASAQTGSASAGDVSIHVDLIGTGRLDVDPQVAVALSDRASAAFQQDSLPALDVGDALLHLSTGSIESEAEYAPAASIAATGSRVTIENLNLSAVDTLGTSLLSISADLIRSRSEMRGDCLQGSGQTGSMFDEVAFQPEADDVVLDNLRVSILGVTVSDLPMNPPHDMIVDLGSLGIEGATLILNEQTPAGDGVHSGSLTSNALHLTLSSAGVITAEVVIARSTAKLDCTQ